MSAKEILKMIWKGKKYRSKKTEKIEQHARPRAPVPGTPVRQEAAQIEEIQKKLKGSPPATFLTGKPSSGENLGEQSVHAGVRSLDALSEEEYLRVTGKKKPKKK